MASIVQDFWKKEIDWGKVEENLNKHTSLKSIFSIDLLKKQNNQPPFYIHPLTRWLHDQGFVTKPATEKLFDVISTLRSCEGWKGKEKKLQASNSENFWGTFFELTVGYSLAKQGFTVKFIEKDNQPDIEASKDEDKALIEAYNFQKFFYRLFELEEIINKINNNHTLLKKYGAKIAVERNIGIKTEVEKVVLERILKFLENESGLSEIKIKRPVAIYESEQNNLQIVLDTDSNGVRYDPSISQKFSSGRFDGYLDQMLAEITNTPSSNKKGFKQLDNCPGFKIGIVSTSFNLDLQRALINWNIINKYQLPSTLDCLIVVANSINENLDFKKQHYLFKNQQSKQEIERLFNLL